MCMRLNMHSCWTKDFFWPPKSNQMCIFGLPTEAMFIFFLICWISPTMGWVTARRCQCLFWNQSWLYIFKSINFQQGGPNIYIYIYQIIAPFTGNLKDKAGNILYFLAVNKIQEKIKTNNKFILLTSSVAKAWYIDIYTLCWRALKTHQ